jgi:DNA-binding IclR family transcriptional regulator
MTDSKGKNTGVQVISRAASILRVAQEYPHGLSLGQLAKQVGLAKSTVQRIVYALEEEGFMVQASSGGFRLGPGLAILGSSVHFDLKEDLHPFLENLSSEIDETVDLAVLDHGKTIFIDQITASHRLQAVSRIGGSFPLHCTANGKALLAALSDSVELTTEELTRYTPNTITNLDALNKELDQIRATGIAFDREEHTVGICAIGATVRDSLGNIAAISIPLPATRFAGNEKRLVSELLKTCENINKRNPF